MNKCIFCTAIREKMEKIKAKRQEKKKETNYVFGSLESLSKTTLIINTGIGNKVLKHGKGRIN